VPGGADLHLLRRVLHDWSDEDAVRILQACSAALPRTGRVLVAESVVDDTRGLQVRWSDIGLMAFGGRERAVAEYVQLLQAAGLAPNRVVEVGFGVQLIEAVRT
jgi:hypothetical protein